MKKGLCLFLILLITLSGCGQEKEGDNDTLDKHEGTIVSIEEKNKEGDVVSLFFIISSYRMAYFDGDSRKWLFSLGGFYIGYNIFGVSN